LTKIQSLAKVFKFIEVIYVPREQNSRADLLSLAKLASTKKSGNNKIVIQEIITSPNMEIIEVNSITKEKEGWMTPILKFLTGSFSPKNDEEEQLIRSILLIDQRS